MGTYDRLDVAGLAAQAVDQLGNITRPFGGGVTVEGVLTPRDAEGNPIGELTEYEKAEDEIVGGILDTSDNAATSTLVDYSNLSYESHHLDSPDDIQAAVDDPKLVVMMPSPRNSDRFIGAVEDDVTDADFEAYLDQRNVSPEQKAALIANRKAQKDKAFELVRNRIRTGLDLSTEIEAPEQGRAPTGDELEMAEEQRNRNTAMRNWRDLGLVTTQDDANALVSRIRRDEEILGVDRRIGTLEGINLLEGGVVELVYVDDEGKETIRDVERTSLDSEQGTIDLNNWMSQGSQVHGSSEPGDWESLVTGEDGTPVPVKTTGSTTIPRERGTVERWEQGTVQTTTYDENGRATGQASVDAEQAWQNSGMDSNGDTLSVMKRIAPRAELVADIITQRTGRATPDIKPYPITAIGNILGDAGIERTDVISFYVPGITEMPVFLPIKQDGNGEQKLKELTQRVLEVADRSGVLTMEELQKVVAEMDYPDAEKLQDVMAEFTGIVETMPVRTRSTNPAP
jgi:hypothetical protein